MLSISILKNIERMMKMLSCVDRDRLLSGQSFIIATDFDDTLVDTEGYSYPNFGKPTEWFFQLKKLMEHYPNISVILFTCREGDDLDMAVNFCRENGLEFDSVNEDIPSTLAWKKIKSRKPFAHIYVDDRAVSYNHKQYNRLGDNRLNNILRSMHILHKLS